MALRLTGPLSTAPGDAAAPAVIVPDLAQRGRTLLAACDLAGYRAVLAEAAALPDPQRAYAAQVRLLEHGLATARDPQAGHGTRLTEAIADEAVRILERDPSQPVLLNLAGVAMHELGRPRAARALLRAARRLDPGLAHLCANLAVVEHRGHRHGPAPRATGSAVTARRAELLAGKARPATGLTLSLCMIVRDEAAMLGRCLQAVAPAVDEIIVVDTGSEDDTAAIAREHGARVIEHPWSGSFAEARNVSFAAATGDWILYLDADEVLVAEDRERLRALTGHTWREAFYLVETSYTGQDGDGAAIVNQALRVFRNRPAYRFTGAIHEQIAPTLPTWAPGRIEATAIRIEHYGYLGRVRAAKDKSRRNLELLRAATAADPGDAFAHFNLGTEYAAAGDPVAAVGAFQAAWSRLQADGTAGRAEYAPVLLVGLVRALRACGRLDSARESAETGLGVFPHLTDLVFEAALSAQRAGDIEAAVAGYTRCLELGDAPARYGATIGAGTDLPRIALAEIDLSRGDGAAALARLQWCAEHRPGYLGLVRPFTTALLATGEDPDGVAGLVAARLEVRTPAARLAVAEGLRAGGALGAAADQFQALLAGDPGRADVRLALVDTLLSLGRFGEAADHAGPQELGDAASASLIRVALTAHLADGRLDTAAALLRGARRAGLSSAECDLFGAWRALASGQAAPPLPVAAAPLLGAVLELLLASGEQASFALVTGALRTSALPEREQRELLAGLWLAHGDLGAAASEWMAVCSTQPDPRALLGLARVAQASGLAEDAVVFASGALEMAPGDADAGRLLAALQDTAVPA